MNASMFFSYGQSKKIIMGMGDGAERQLSLNEVFAAGLMTGAAISFVEGPFDHLKCKLQVFTRGRGLSIVTQSPPPGVRLESPLFELGVDH